jgi:hypothetical protein
MSRQRRKTLSVATIIDDVSFYPCVRPSLLPFSFAMGFEGGPAGRGKRAPAMGDTIASAYNSQDRSRNDSDRKPCRDARRAALRSVLFPTR